MSEVVNVTVRWGRPEWATVSAGPEGWYFQDPDVLVGIAPDGPMSTTTVDRYDLAGLKEWVMDVIGKTGEWRVASYVARPIGEASSAEVVRTRWSVTLFLGSGGRVVKTGLSRPQADAIMGKLGDEGEVIRICRPSRMVEHVPVRAVLLAQVVPEW